MNTRNRQLAAVLGLVIAVAIGSLATIGTARADETSTIGKILKLRKAPGVTLVLDILKEGLKNLYCQSWFQPMWDALPNKLAKPRTGTWDKRLEATCNEVLKACSGPPATVQRAKDILAKLKEMRAVAAKFAADDIGISFACRTYGLGFVDFLSPEMTKFCERLVPDLKDLLKGFDELPCTPVQVGALDGSGIYVLSTEESCVTADGSGICYSTIESTVEVSDPFADVPTDYDAATDEMFGFEPTIATCPYEYTVVESEPIATTEPVEYEYTMPEISDILTFL